MWRINGTDAEDHQQKTSIHSQRIHKKRFVRTSQQASLTFQCISLLLKIISKNYLISNYTIFNKKRCQGCKK